MWLQILAAPAPGSNDAARLAGQPTTTLDAEVLVSGNDLIPFNAQKEQAVANSIKAILANYTTVVSVNGATVSLTISSPPSTPFCFGSAGPSPLHLPVWVCECLLQIKERLPEGW